MDRPTIQIGEDTRPMTDEEWDWYKQATDNHVDPFLAEGPA